MIVSHAVRMRFTWAVLLVLAAVTLFLAPSAWAADGQAVSSGVQHGLAAGTVADSASSQPAAADAESSSAASSAGSSSAAPPADEELVAVEADLPEGFYAIARADYAKTRIGPASASNASGANIELVKRRSSDEGQIWYLTRNADSTYKIVSYGSGKALQAGKAKSSVGNVVQKTPKSTKAQKWSIFVNDDGSYSLVAKSSGLVLTAAGKKAGSNIQVRSATGKAAQKFSIKPVNMISDGVYSLGLESDSSRVAQVAKSSQKTGAKVTLGSYGKAFNQKFQVKGEGDNVYTIQAVHSGKRLTAKGENVVQAKRSKAKSQRWQLAYDGAGLVLRNVASGKLMTFASLADTARLRLHSAKGFDVQHLAFSKRMLVNAGLYTFKSQAASRFLQVKGGSKVAGANIQVHKANGFNTQKFRVSSVGNGYYKLVNATSGLVVQAGAGSSKANVSQGAYTGADGQKWKPVVSAAGGVNWVSKKSGKVLALSGGKTANGTNVVVAKKSSAKARAWNLAFTTKTVDDRHQARALKKVKARYSATNYAIAVDLTQHRTFVFKWKGAAWKLVKDYLVSTGAPETPTVTGDYTVGIKGYSFGNGFTCYYYTQFYGDYLFHSVLYNQGTFDIQDGRLGYSISHGCVRMDINDAYWIYSHIPAGTMVTVYY